MNELELKAQLAADACPIIDWPEVIDEIDIAGIRMAALARIVKTSEPSIAAIRHRRTQEPRGNLAIRILAVRECVISNPRETYSSTESETV